jgi:hypothetical protein
MLPAGAITGMAALVLPVLLAGAGLDAAKGADAPLAGGLVVPDDVPDPEGLDELVCEPPAVLAPPLSPPPPPHAASTKATARACTNTLDLAEKMGRIFSSQANKKVREDSIMARSVD